MGVVLLLSVKTGYPQEQTHPLAHLLSNRRFQPQTVQTCKKNHKAGSQATRLRLYNEGLGTYLRMGTREFPRQATIGNSINDIPKIAYQSAFRLTA